MIFKNYVDSEHVNRCLICFYDFIVLKMLKTFFLLEYIYLFKLIFQIYKHLIKNIK